MTDKIKTLKLWSSESYSVEWHENTIDMGDYNPEEQVNVLLGLIYNQLPGDVFEALAKRLGITEERLADVCP